jgi:hypothetical protein
MNEDQLDVRLRDLKSSSREPDTFDTCLEDRIMKLSTCTTIKRRRTKKLVTMVAVLLVSGTGFVALGGDSAVVNYISPSTEKDADGNIVPHDFSLGKWLHKAHDHMFEYFHDLHTGK